MRSSSKINWRQKKGTNSYKEEIFLAYFLELSKILKPNTPANTLWSRFSMKKSMVKLKENIDIGKFFELTTFLKKQSVGFKPKKANVFDKNDIAKIMLTAPNNIYLLIKIATIFGLAGACRRTELTKITLDDFEDKESYVTKSKLKTLKITPQGRSSYLTK